MLSLGRTSSGAIKIKTDEAGGGLRAVGCACCGGGCGCAITVPTNLQSILLAATAGTLWGMPSTYWEPTGFDDGWIMEWQHPESNPGMEFSLYYTPPFCLHGGGYYFIDNEDTIAKYARFSSSPNFQEQNCIQPNFTTAPGTFTINGIGPITYYYITGNTLYPELQYGPPPVLNFTLS